VAALVANRLSAPPTPLEEVVGNALLEQHDIRLWIKRDDLIHPTVPGNKLRKLKYNLGDALRGNYDSLLTFGGAYSNHVYATAHAGKLCGLKTIGVIRGEEHLPLNPVLASAVAAGMKLVYLDRQTYRSKRSPEVLDRLREQHGHFYLVPEGGSNHLGVRGASEIIDEIDVDFDVVATAVGTGGTLAGLIFGLQGKGSALGFATLKGAVFLRDDVTDLLGSAGRHLANWGIELDYHFGGFARVQPELVDFIEKFEQDHDVPLDPIYTGKMMYGLFDIVGKGRLPRGTRVVAVHTGGVPRSHWAGLLGG
jgi:1-aminocyclopropane-1-carboxylate deaminase